MRPRPITGLGIFLPLFVVSTAFGEVRNVGPPDLTGGWWLNQPAAARHTFVRGWTDGYVMAWVSAQARLIAVVEETREAVPPDGKLAAALLVSVTVLQEAHPDYGRSPAHYADQVTTFFTSHPDLRDCPIGLVLKGLDGRNPMSLEGIAHWLRETWAR
jgi:hypothetical protein